MAKKIYTDEEARERKNARQREYAKRTNYAADIKSKKKNAKRYVMDVFYHTEGDIIDKLESVDNKSGYIKDLIRNDIKNSGE